MRRREFLGLISGTAAWPLAARAQQTGMPVIGVLSPQSAGPTTASRIAGFLQGLSETQYMAGRTDPFGKAEYEKLSMSYLRLAEQAATRREQTAKRGISPPFPEQP